MNKKAYIIRLFDELNNEWIDLSFPTSYSEAWKIYNEYTINGTQNTKKEDKDYFEVMEVVNQ